LGPGGGAAAVSPVLPRAGFKERAVALRWTARGLAALLVVPLVAGGAAAGDWPHLRGPSWSGTSDETGLADAWPAEGPPVLWHADMGQGFSGFVVAGGRAYTQAQWRSGQHVVCLDADTGRRLWQRRTGWPWRMEGHWPGPMATPTLTGDRLYFAGAYGLVGCMQARDGRLLWSRNVTEEFGGRGTEYGYACSPLVLDGKVYLPVGGKGAAVVALDAADGALVWRAGDWLASYTPCLLISVGGRRQVLAYLQNVVAAFDPETGGVLWSHRISEGYDEHAAWPLYHEPNLVVARAFGGGATCLRFGPAGGPPEVAWETRDFSNDVLSGVALDGAVYGFDLHDFQAQRNRQARGVLRCLDLATGAVRWTAADVPHASVVAADGKLVLWTETGTLILARASAEGYDELARTPVFAGEVCWTAPALADGRLYLRTHTQAACVWLGRPEALGARQPVTVASRLARARPAGQATAGVPRRDVWRGRALYAPTWRHLTTWFLYTLAAVLGPAAALALVVLLLVRDEEPARRQRAARLAFAATAVALGAAGTWVLSRAAGAFIFTWPAVVFVVYHATALAAAGGQRGRTSEARRRRWAARGAIGGLALVCLAYAWLCRHFGVMMGYGFLAGLVPAFPAAAVAAWRMERRPHPARDLAWTLVAFAAWFWASAAFTVWKTHQ
jgi:outer membrane protein assembly factor BamB